MSKNLDIDALRNEHSSLYLKCESFCQEIVHQILHLLEEKGISTAVPLQFRAKKWDSILDKIEQKRFNIKKSVTELQDLSGIRIILLFSRDKDVVKEIMHNNFSIIKEYNSEERLNDDQFGYSSTHIIAQLKKEWLKIPTLSVFKGMNVEFQIRTLSQHSWSEVSNILQYKNEENVPKPLKRSISRISALLETVDLEYERLLSDREKYKKELKQTNFDDFESELNVDLMDQILNQYLPANNKVAGEDYSDLLHECELLDINSSKALINLIKENLPSVSSFDKEIAKKIQDAYMKDKSLSCDGYAAQDYSKIEKGCFFTHVGLIRQMLKNVYGERYEAIVWANMPDEDEKPDI